MSSSALSPPWMKNKKTGNLPIFRTGIDKTLDMDEPIYQQPTNQNKPVLIEQPGLFYNGHHFMQFLRQYEMTADSLNASKYDRALQIGRFVQTEELKCQIEAMDGYEECDWDILRASMFELWGDEYEIWYTTTDLVNLSEEFSRDNKTVSFQAFQTYLQNFSKILDFLLIQKQLRSRQDALVIFISAFPQEIQRNIKRNLNQNGQLPQAPNGSRLPPLWEHLTEAAGVEIKLKELAKEIESPKQQLQESQSPVICNTPHSLSQLEPATEYTEPATGYTEPATEHTELATDYTELAINHTEPATEYTEPATDYMELAKDHTEPATEYTEPATDYTELVINHTEPATEYTEPATGYTELETDYTELVTDHTEPATEYTEPATDYMELAKDHTEPATDYTELAKEYAESATEDTELAKDHTEPATDYMELGKDYTEPEANYTELTIADTEKSMDVTIPVASMHMTEPVTTTKLLDLEEWKAASINVMDTPMDLAHTVIKIPDIILDEPDTENHVDQSTQPETLDQLPSFKNNPVKIQNLLRAEHSKEDHKFPAIPGKFWICNINKYLEIKIFNKQLFKPLSDIFGLLRINNHLSQHLEMENTQIEEPKYEIISVHSPLAPENFETTDLPNSSQPVPPSISTASIPEKVFSIPTPPDPPDITTTFINPQNEANWKTRQLSKLTINNLALSKLPRELFLLFYSLQKICPQLPLSIPPDLLQKSYGNVKRPRLMVGVG
ncbi:hypothetical protein PGT21_019454 [Puccinia graminis f. sp. tritici]|uniref:Uncharacterized protein n=1 Tax=Puccinia graminis f. sp. tritici TaxID=56615 RepID=A0A5B0R135_PUCGR|nr:hypothetical protein PGT21_019454 [Puccinia graminis f. sp. tritici]